MHCSRVASIWLSEGVRCVEEELELELELAE